MTWAPHLGADAVFFVGRQASQRGAFEVEAGDAQRILGDDDGASAVRYDVVELNVDDSYDGLSQKTWAIARWALEHGYEAVFKVNDDVVIFPARFGLPPRDADYAGWVQDDGTWIQGHAYWLRRRALEAIAAAPMPAVIPGAVEDRWVGWAMGAAGIPAVSEPRIGCVRRPQGRTAFDLARMLRATEPFYAAAEFNPEEIVALYDAVYGGTVWRR